VARAFDLRLGRCEFEFETRRMLALPGSDLGKSLTPTGLADRSGLVRACLAAGEKPPSVCLSRQLLLFAVLGTGCSTFPAVARLTQPSTCRGPAGTVK